jgi:signal transduction histidine kinase
VGELRRRLGTVRVRTTIGATAAVGLALVVGSVVLMNELRARLVADVETAARLRAEDVAGLLERGVPPLSLAIDEDDESIVQVLLDDGGVILSSNNIEGEGPIADLDDDAATTVDGIDVGEEGERPAFRVVSLEVEGPRDEYTVLVARTLESADEGVEAVRHVLLVGVPLLGLVVAATTWVVTGRALRPVESIRAEVAEINAGELDRRVPEPIADDEVARLARTMNDMLARLETARDRQQRFVSDASHELRSPIATIRHELEVAIANPAGVDLEQLAAGLLDEDLRMQALVEDLLLLARSDEGGDARPRRPIDIDDLVLEEAARVRGRGRVTVDVTAVSAGQVLGERSQLERVVRNLVENAERHANRAIGLTLATIEDRVILTVSDDGPGIRIEDRERVFERFTRLDEARARSTGGYGLGLAIVREVVEHHGGGVSVTEATSGPGARFVVDLPAT